MKKIVLTGAAGRLGSYLREPLSKMCNELVSTENGLLSVWEVQNPRILSNQLGM